MRALAALPSLSFALALSCEGDATLFTADREPQVCEDNIPSACRAMARCVLDKNHYLQGRFPGAQTFIVRTAAETDLRFEFLLEDRYAPGTSLRLEISEPTCIEKSFYDSAGKDIFREINSEGILGIPFHARMAGDHLVRFSADATCSYKLRVE